MVEELRVFILWKLDLTSVYYYYYFLITDQYLKIERHHNFLNKLENLASVGLGTIIWS